MAPPAGAAPAQQLAEVLAVLASSDGEDMAAQRGVERIAECFEAEVGALLRGGAVAAVIGFGVGKVPEPELLEAAAGERRHLEVPGAGVGAVATVPVERETESSLVLVRSGEEGFDREELSLLRGMAKVLALALRMLRSVDTLQQSEEHARAILHYADDAFISMDAQGLVTAWNEKAVKTFGWPEAEACGRRLSELVVPPQHREAHNEGLARFLATGEGSVLNRRIEITASREDGIEIPVELAIWPVFSKAAGSWSFNAFVREISERKNAADALREANLRLQELASTDALTGLPNRALFSDRLDQALSLARRERLEVALLFLDLDRFKDVNDSLGHRAGDDLLVEVSRRLGEALRGSDTVARLGGDEFGVLLGGTASPEEAAGAAERILTSFREPFNTGGIEFFTSASVGVALWPEDCNSKAELLQHADVAMYRAKAAGGNRFEMFQPAMTVAARDRLTLESELRQALEAGEFFLRYQPQVALGTGMVMGVEALVRWDHPRRGEVMPLDFIPLAEENGLIVPIGAWVLGEACRQAVRWRVELADRAPLRMAVNVSPRQLTHPGFAAQVGDALVESGLPAHELELEITESTIITDNEAAISTLKTLRQLGVRLAIDDFGSGYSSLGYLQRFPVDRLKLDMSFIAGLGRTGAERQDGHNHAALVAAAVDLAHALGMEAVAEGVETEEQRNALVEIGSEQAQGFLWARPLRSDELAGWLAAAPA